MNTELISILQKSSMTQSLGTWSEPIKRRVHTVFDNQPNLKIWENKHVTLLTSRSLMYLAVTVFSKSSLWFFFSYTFQKWWFDRDWNGQVCYLVLIDNDTLKWPSLSIVLLWIALLWNFALKNWQKGHSRLSVLWVHTDCIAT